jgi:hypothetical protein
MSHEGSPVGHEGPPVDINDLRRGNSRVGFSEAAFQIPQVRDYLMGINALNDLHVYIGQGVCDHGLDCGPNDELGVALRARHYDAEMMLRATLAVFTNNPERPKEGADPRGYIMGMLNQALFGFGLEVVRREDSHT